MNELIGELVEKSYIYDHQNDSSFFNKEKFAELMIDECCLKLLDMDEKTNGRHNYYKHASLQIKEHFFGVKL